MHHWFTAVAKKLGAWVPGLSDILHYNPAFFKSDFMAGLAVAAVALPTSIAYAQLAGLPPQTGIYSTIIPMIVYTFFGTSRQLIVGPDASTCAMLASALAPIASAAASPEEYQSLVFTLTMMAGVLFIVAGKLRLGFLADLQSRPILMGLMNGVAIMIIIGQLSNIIGVTLTGKDTIGQLQSLFLSLRELHWPTLLFSMVLFVVYFASPYVVKKISSMLIVAVVAIILTILFSLSDYGIQTIGAIPASIAGFPRPSFPHEQLGNLFFGAVALVFVSYISASRVAHSFAAKNNYEIDNNKELIALGITNISSALGQGFAISGADSRTAVSDACGGKTRLVQLFAALIIMIVIILFADPIGYMPMAGLGVILIGSAIKMTNLAEIMQLRRYSRTEFYIASITCIAVLLLGVIHAVIFAILLALLSFLQKTARPVDHCMGLLPDQNRFYEVDYYPQAQEIPGILFYRFDASLIFLNASYFRQRVKILISRPNIVPIRWVVVDGGSINNIDITAIMMLSQLGQELEGCGILLAFADSSGHLRRWMDKHNINENELTITIYKTRHAALNAYQQSTQEPTTES